MFNIVSVILSLRYVFVLGREKEEKVLKMFQSLILLVFGFVSLVSFSLYLSGCRSRTKASE